MSGARSWVDPEEGLREWLALGKAPDADSLHRVLVMHRPIRHSADTLEPMSLLRRIHESEPEEAFSTAFLLLTDRRWRKGLSQLVRKVEDSGCLADDDLDELARLFVAADKALFFAVPEEWFGDAEIVFETLDVAPDDVPDDDDGEQARAAREVHPPLRRWAAARLIERGLAEVSALFDRTGEVDARAAAAIMAGLLDSVDSCDASTRDRLIDRAVAWPDHGVRRVGIELVADRDGADAAYGLAIEDPNARIRDWAPSLLADKNGEGDSPVDDRTGARGDDQPSLF